VHIRAARDQDFKACLALDLTYETDVAWQMTEIVGEGEWGAHFREVRLPRKQKITPAYPPEVRLKAWERRDGFWVASDQRKLLGFIAVSLEYDHYQARITDLGVAADSRRQGVATDLLNHVIEWCARSEVAQLIYECPPKAQPAIGFALKHRFVFCGFQDAYWPDQTTVLFFRKRLRG